MPEQFTATACQQEQPLTPREIARIVATVHCEGDIVEARALDSSSGIDFLELRLDCLEASLGQARELAAAAPRPLLMTARGPAEGGANPKLDERARMELLRTFLPHATGLDIELADTPRFDALIGDARAVGKLVVLSMHDFDGTPGWKELVGARDRAFAQGADVFKVATRLATPDDFHLLHRLVFESPAGSVSAMGMGPMGMASRLFLACAGSRLNYGYLSRPNAPGQWPAARLAEVLRECQVCR